MRHVESVLVALLAGPLLFVLTGRGLGGLAEVAAEAEQAEQTDYFAIATGAAAVGLAGLLFALLTMARITPPGPALAGSGFLTVGIWALADPDRLFGSLPADRIGLTDGQLATAATVSPLLAVPLLVPLFVPRRWRGPDRGLDRGLDRGPDRGPDRGLDRGPDRRPGAAPPDLPPAPDRPPQ